VNFNSKITDKRAPLVSRRTPLPRGRHAPRRQRGFKPLSGPRAARPDSVTAHSAPARSPRLALAARRPLPRPLRRVPTASPTPPDSRLAHAAVVQTAHAPTAAVRSRIARTVAGRLAVTRRHRPSPLRRCLRTGEPPLLPSPVRRCRAAAGSPSSATTEPCVVRPRGRGPRTRCARGPSRRRGRGPRALCVWAEREFGPVAPG
jgi:hypothetical protein